MTPRDDEIAQYAAAVRSALDDLPEADREELVEDLEDHLAEVAAESAEPLTIRLGIPEDYADELRAAYGSEGEDTKRSLRATTLANLDLLERRLKQEFDKHEHYQRIWDFFGELRPAWWLVRGYLAAMLVWFALDEYWHLRPHGFRDVALAVALALGSAVLGIRARGRADRRSLRAVLIGANAVALAGMLFLWAEDGTGPAGIEPARVTYSAAPQPESSPMPGTVNIYPYSKDGKPLKDVLLYDQNGRPIQLNHEDEGFVLVQPCGSPPPITNAFPLPLKHYDEMGPEPEETPSCDPATPTPAPRPDESASPTASPSPSPSPSKTG